MNHRTDHEISYIIITWAGLSLVAREYVNAHVNTHAHADTHASQAEGSGRRGGAATARAPSKHTLRQREQERTGLRI